MPEVSRFFGICIVFFFNDHNPPHFHATYKGRMVEVDIWTLGIIEGGIATRALGLVMEWAAEHRAELVEDWRRASSGEPIVRIAPLS